MCKSALIVWGGWEGHEPEAVSNLFAQLLQEQGFDVQISSSLDSFLDFDRVSQLDLIVPVVTMAKITAEQSRSVTRAVAEHGVGLAGCHGGMCDAFREDTEWQFMTGGQWVAHPGNDGVRYKVCISRDHPHQITDGVPDFEVVSEQYYLHVDPGIEVLAYTHFPHDEVPGVHSGNKCKMPQVWTKTYGKGKVFYCALGHQRAVLEEPHPKMLMSRGFAWAASKD